MYNIITPKDGRVMSKHVSTNNKKVNDFVILMDNKEQILSVNECNRMLKYNIYSYIWYSHCECFLCTKKDDVTHNLLIFYLKKCIYSVIGAVYPQKKLALTSLTSGGRSVDIVRLRTETTEFLT
jgi:hypothetical protein